MMKQLVAADGNLIMPLDTLSIFAILDGKNNLKKRAHIMNYRIYLDTSGFGGVFDKEFKKPSKALFEQIESGLCTLVTSAVVQP